MNGEASLPQNYYLWGDAHTYLCLRSQDHLRFLVETDQIRYAISERNFRYGAVDGSLDYVLLVPEDVFLAQRTGSGSSYLLPSHFHQEWSDFLYVKHSEMYEMEAGVTSGVNWKLRKLDLIRLETLDSTRLVPVVRDYAEEDRGSIDYDHKIGGLFRVSPICATFDALGFLIDVRFTVAEMHRYKVWASSKVPTQKVLAAMPDAEFFHYIDAEKIRLKAGPYILTRSDTRFGEPIQLACNAAYARLNRDPKVDEVFELMVGYARHLGSKGRLWRMTQQSKKQFSMGPLSEQLITEKEIKDAIRYRLRKKSEANVQIRRNKK